MKHSPWRFNACPKNSKARPNGSKIHIHPTRSPSLHGSPHASEDGTATISPQDPRPCAMVGTDSPQHSTDMPLLLNRKIRESRSPERGRAGVGVDLPPKK